VSSPQPAARVAHAQPAADPTPAAPAPLELPAPVACTFREPRRWIEVTLGFAADAPYARVAAQLLAQEVDFPVGGKPESVGVRVAVQGVRLAGIAPARDYPLSPARVIVLDEVFVLKPTADLQLRAAAPGQLDFELDVECVQGVQTPLRMSRSCEHFTLTSGDFEELDAVGGKVIGERLMQAGRPIALAAQPKGPKVVELVPDEDHRATDLLAVRGTRARIAWPLEHVVVVGWVDRAELAPVGFWCRNDDVRWFKSEPVPPVPGSFRCAQALDLIAERAGERRIVGQASPGVQIVERAARGDFVAVELPDARIELIGGALLLARRADLERCRATSD
jgi:hypothetical protein